MKGVFLFSFLTLLLASGQTGAQAQTAPADSTLRLWYTRPAETWTEALPVGNGSLGAMIFGGVETEHIQFNHETLWSGHPRSYHREGAAEYLPRIRQLIFEGKQAEAEDLAWEHFMGTLSNEDSYDERKTAWLASLYEAGKADAGSTPQPATRGMGGNPTLAGYDDTSWETMKIPTPNGWRDLGLEGLNGSVWFRTKFQVPEDWAGENLVLDLGRIRDEDVTWLNGKKLGSTTGKDEHRRYVIPAAYLQPGENLLAIQVLSYFDKGGFTGFAGRYRDKLPEGARGQLLLYPESGMQELPLRLSETPWKYKIQDPLPPEFPDFMARYLPFGDLHISFPEQEEAGHYTRELDIAQALARTSYDAGGVRYTREYFSSAPDSVIAVHLTANQAGKISFDARLSTPHFQSSVRKTDERTLGLFLQVWDGALKGVSYLRVDADGGEVTVSDGLLRVRGADQATLYLTAATNFIDYKDTSGDPEAIATQLQQALSEKSYNEVRRDHVRDYRSYFDTFRIRLGDPTPASGMPTDERISGFADGTDPALAALYVQYGRYLLLSSSRPGGQPANLQGIWNNLMLPPWESKFTTNVNLEMNYWPANVLHLAPGEEPLFRMIEDLAETGAETARAHYDCRGWVLHHNTDLWRGTAPINASSSGIWVGGGAWLCHHLWEHFRFHQDEAFLRDTAYPLMKGAALFYVDYLVRDPETGWLVSSPSNSPEIGGLVAGPTMDHQLIRDLFNNCIQASTLLGIDNDFRDLLKEKIGQIAPNQIGRHGQLQEWIHDIDDPEEEHRHASHLWGVFPGQEINWEHTPDLMKAARQSLLFRGDGGTGWSLAWKINLWARFRDGDHAYRMLENLLRPAVESDGGERGGSYLNLFDAHPPFQIDGNFGGAAGIAEMLLQSQGDDIELLPALPAAWASGAVEGIRARGGFVLNFSWKNGELQELEILSEAGGECRLRYRGVERVIPTKKGDIYKLNQNLQEI